MSRVFISIFAALVLLAGCSDEEDILPTQKTKIVSYLTGTHSPKLVAYEELEEGSDEPYFTTSGNAERSGMGFTIMQTFTDGCEVESAAGTGTKVRMKKKFGKKAGDNAE